MKFNLILLVVIAFLTANLPFEGAEAQRGPRRPKNPARTKVVDMVKNAKIVRSATAKIRSKRVFKLNSLQLKSLSAAAKQHAGSFTRLVISMSKTSRSRVTNIMKKSVESAVRIADSVKTMTTAQLAGSGINSVVNSVAFTVRGDIVGAKAKRVSKISEEVATGLESGKSPSLAFNQAPSLKKVGRNNREKYKKRCR